MKAIVLNSPGGVENLIYTDVALPAIKDNEVLVKVKAISINPVDVKTRAGKGVYGRIKDQGPIVLGWDISGTIVETGKAVQSFDTGQDVFGMVNFPGHGKAYAEYVAVPVEQLALKPDGVTHEQAAASTLAALTAWQALTRYYPLKAGDKVLIHAASGGVGHFAVQIAKHLGAYVVGTSSATNRDFVLGLGADEHIDYRDYDWNKRIDAFDFVFDTLGGDNIDLSIHATKKGGTVISIPSGLNESVTAKASAKGVDGFFFLVQSSGKNMEQIASLLHKGVLVPHIFKAYSFDQMGEAHLQQESGRTRGKLIIVPPTKK